MTLRRPTATIDLASPRAAKWLADFGTDTVPIKSPVPHRSHLEGLGVREVYVVDVAALAPEVLERLVRGLAADFAIPPEEVRAGLLGDHGLPILASEVSVTFDARLVL
jgi:hypothetical protein